MAKIFKLGEEKECAVELYALDKSAFLIQSATFKLYDDEKNLIVTDGADIIDKKVYTTIKPPKVGRFELVFYCTIVPLLNDIPNPDRKPQTVLPNVQIICNY